MAGASFSPDGSMLASASGTSVYLWSVPQRSLIAELPSQRGWINGVAFNPNGPRLSRRVTPGQRYGTSTPSLGATNSAQSQTAV
ncbi:WD40 repeat domain-containing protein [Virgisporangium aurantiacum]|uniref:WD40 repeat domain-containing protein n=1 Tax=Virgisporangium aurantiacum TaxID=175570 RepID=UPI0035716543